MKLMLCPHCLDVQRIQNDVRSCTCGRSAAYADAEHKVTVTGAALILGLNSEDVYWATYKLMHGQATPAPVNGMAFAPGTRNTRYARPEKLAQIADLGVDIG